MMKKGNYIFSGYLIEKDQHSLQIFDSSLNDSSGGHCGLNAGRFWVRFPVGTALLFHLMFSFAVSQFSGAWFPTVAPSFPHYIAVQG